MSTQVVQTGGNVRLIVSQDALDPELVLDAVEAAAPAVVIPTVSAQAGILEIATTAQAALTSVSPALPRISVAFPNGPSAQYRRAVAGTVPYEGGLAGAVTTAGGEKWIFDEQRIRPEWMNMGAKPDSNGLTGVGVDSAPAIRAMQATAETLGIQWYIPPGKWRMASMITPKQGGRAMIALGSNSRGLIEGDLVHDLFTDGDGSPVGIWTNATPSQRIQNVQLIFNGGSLQFPNDAVAIRPGVSNKSGIKMYCVDGVQLIRPATTGITYTGFQIEINDCTEFAVWGGYAGFINAPTADGNDGVHCLNGAKRGTIIGVRSNSGDDQYSFTCEGNATVPAQNQILEEIDVFAGNGSSFTGRSVKLHLVNSVNCTIRNIRFHGMSGTPRSNILGGGVAILNDDVTRGGVIDNITFNDCSFNIGTLPKTNPNGGTGGGDAVFVRDSSNVKFFNCHMVGSSNALLTFRSCVGGGWFGGSLTSAGTLPVLVPAATISSTQAGSGASNGFVQVNLSGAPDLSSVATALAAFTAGAQAQDNKLPILRVTAGMNAYNTGDFLIRAVDNTAKWVAIESLRPGGSGQYQTGVTGSASILLSKVPDIQVIDCQGVRIDTNLINQMGWCGAWLGTRGGTLNDRCRVFLDLDGATYGNGIFIQRGTKGKYRLNAENVRSGSVGIRNALTGAVTESYNEFLDSTDHSGMADATQGWGRFLSTDYKSDRIGKLRGITSSVIKGTVTIGTAATSVNITANAGVLAGYSDLTGFDLSWITVTPPPGATGWGVAYSGGTFTISVPSAPAAALVFGYKIAPPN